jgi:hypothetical protein
LIKKKLVLCVPSLLPSANLQSHVHLGRLVAPNGAAVDGTAAAAVAQVSARAGEFDGSGLGGGAGGGAGSSSSSSSSIGSSSSGASSTSLGLLDLQVASLLGGTLFRSYKLSKPEALLRDEQAVVDGCAMALRQVARLGPECLIHWVKVW